MTFTLLERCYLTVRSAVFGSAEPLSSEDFYAILLQTAGRNSRAAQRLSRAQGPLLGLLSTPFKSPGMAPTVFALTSLPY